MPKPALLMIGANCGIRLALTQQYLDKGW